MDFEELSSFLRQRDGDGRQLSAHGGPEQDAATAEAAPRDTLVGWSLKVAALLAAVVWASATIASWLMEAPAFAASFCIRLSETCAIFIR